MEHSQQLVFGKRFEHRDGVILLAICSASSPNTFGSM